MSDYYRLNENCEPVRATLEEASLSGGDWEARHRVDKTTVGQVEVSTVFLGLDHSFVGGPPILFETMIFGGLLDQHQERYHTWDEAVDGHRRAVWKVRFAVFFWLAKKVRDFAWRFRMRRSLARRRKS